MRGSEALAILHISGRRRCAAVPHDVDRYTEQDYSAGTLLQPRTLREATTIKCAVQRGSGSDLLD